MCRTERRERQERIHGENSIIKTAVDGCLRLRDMICRWKIPGQRRTINIENRQFKYTKLLFQQTVFLQDGCIIGFES